jgi:hypothetical protein
MRPLGERLDPEPWAELLHVLILHDFERADRREPSLSSNYILGAGLP